MISCSSSSSCATDAVNYQHYDEYIPADITEIPCTRFGSGLSAAMQLGLKSLLRYKRHKQKSCYSSASIGFSLSRTWISRLPFRGPQSLNELGLPAAKTKRRPQTKRTPTTSISRSVDIIRFSWERKVQVSAADDQWERLGKTEAILNRVAMGKSVRVISTATQSTRLKKKYYS